MTESDLSHLDERGMMRMVDAADKPATDRRAVAEGFLIMGEEVMRVVRGGQTPKGDVLAAARLAGITAAKRTSELIPLCHSISLSHVAVTFDLLPDRIRVVASASAHAKTGVEMEALTAVAVAALTLYDMLKALSHEMVIADVRLLEKSGGKSHYRRVAESPGESQAPSFALVGSHAGVPSIAAAPRPIRAAVLTVSDRCSAGTAGDTAGPAVARMLENQLRAAVEWHGILPDEADHIARRLEELAADGIDLIVTVGGTGCTPRDVTPEATRAVIVREVQGLSEAMRTTSTKHTPHAALQRGICGIRDSSLIVNLPGSEKAATQNLDAILPVLSHAIDLILMERRTPEHDAGEVSN